MSGFRYLRVSISLIFGNSLFKTSFARRKEYNERIDSVKQSKIRFNGFKKGRIASFDVKKIYANIV